MKTKQKLDTQPFPNTTLKKQPRNNEHLQRLVCSLEITFLMKRNWGFLGK